MKSPFKPNIAGVAIEVKRSISNAINGAHAPENLAVDASHEVGTNLTNPSGSSSNFPLPSNQLSTSYRRRGTHKPVKIKAERTPRPASIPNERNAGISENKLDINAPMVVNDVSIIALPTFEIDMYAEVSVLFPERLSSLYLCNAWRLSSIPRARINIGRRLENCDL